MVYELVTGPASEPITVGEVKEHLKIDGTAEDAYIGDLITAAREMVCRLTGRALVNESWRLLLDRWPSSTDSEWWDGVREGPITMIEASYVDLKRAPFGAVTAVKTYDEAGSATTWASSNYYVAPQHGFGRLVRKRGATWPVPDRDVAGIAVEFTVGYGADASDVPVALRHACKLLVAHWFEKREPASECASSDLMPMGLGSIISQYRVVRV